MSKVTFLVVCFLCSININYAQKGKRTLELIKLYNADGYYVIETVKSLPTTYQIGDVNIKTSTSSTYEEYIEGTTEKEWIASTNTIVHEMNHAFSSQMVYKAVQDAQLPYTMNDKYIVIYTQNQSYLLIQFQEVFPSRELAALIPTSLRTFRFDTYINSSSKILGTQQFGIYGLLNEWNAYYQGTKASLQLYDYYAKQNNNQAWLDYMQNVEGTLYAYQEFKFYILQYLLYAQKKHPIQYKQIIENTNFKQAFVFVDTYFKKLIDEYFVIRQKIAENLSKQNIKMEISEGYTFIEMKGIGNFSEEHALLNDELNKPIYTPLIQVLYTN
ncbi:MAG: hypothetical protein EAZ55_14595 [Cytophagales bacterium]|nr:MAG: hypothetical protein EAZ55_14595 [Cytophagales bacterium]